MVTICESIMLICFGFSWPISVAKSLKTRSTKGKSPLFLTLILLGYIAGITGKLLGNNITYVLAFYIFNLCVVSMDFALYFINRSREKKEEAIK